MLQLPNLGIHSLTRLSSSIILEEYCKSRLNSQSTFRDSFEFSETIALDIYKTINSYKLTYVPGF